MAGFPYTIAPFFTTGGIDLTSKDKEVSPYRARSAKNVIKLTSEAAARRWGQKAKSNNAETNSRSFGTFGYSYRDSVGTTTNEILVVGKRLFRRVQCKLNIAYTGANQVYVQLLVDPAVNVWKCGFFRDGTQELSAANENLGTGEPADKTVENLRAALDALVGVTATVSIVSPNAIMSAATAGGHPAAFLDSTLATFIPTTSSIDIFFYVMEEVVHPNTSAGAGNPHTPWTVVDTNKNSEGFEILDALQTENIILFLSKYVEQWKYDGDVCCRAGLLPSGLDPLVLSGAGALNGTYLYSILMKYVDAQGNNIESIESNQRSASPVNQTVKVPFGTISADDGFNTDTGLTNAAAAATNEITLAAGHTLQKGETVYFWDSDGGAYTTRKITNVAGNVITLDGATFGYINYASAVSLDKPKGVVSANLRIVVLRSEAAGTILQRRREVPYHPALALYDDSTEDIASPPDFVSPALLGVDHGLPPKGNYGAIYNGRPVIAGNLEEPNKFYWAAPASPEYYPSQYSDYARGNRNVAISGLLATNDYLWINKENESFLLVGNLYTGQYKSAPRGDAVGCVSHHSGVRMDKGCIWLGDGAVYMSFQGERPRRISDKISTVFSENKNLSSDRRFNFDRAIGFYDKFTELYFLYLPAESTDGSYVYANSHSRIWVLNLRLSDPATNYWEWFEWDGFNVSGGVDFLGRELVWTSRDVKSSNPRYWMYRRINNGNVYDYVDHVNEISWEYIPGWLKLKPGLPFKVTHVKPSTTDPVKTSYYTLNVTTEHDFVDGYARSSFAVNFGINPETGTGWGSGPWGLFPWGSPSADRNRARRLKNVISKESFRSTFKAGGIYTEIVLGGWDLQIATTYKAKMHDIKTS